MKQYRALKDMPWWEKGHIITAKTDNLLRLETVGMDSYIYGTMELDALIRDGWIEEVQPEPELGCTECWRYDTCGVATDRNEVACGDIEPVGCPKMEPDQSEPLKSGDMSVTFAPEHVRKVEPERGADEFERCEIRWPKDGTPLTPGFRRNDGRYWHLKNAPGFVDYAGIEDERGRPMAHDVMWEEPGNAHLYEHYAPGRRLVRPTQVRFWRASK